jgi:hypothetical protein
MKASEARLLVYEWPEKRLNDALYSFFLEIQEAAKYGETSINIPIRGDMVKWVNGEPISELIKLGYEVKMTKPKDINELFISWNK